MLCESDTSYFIVYCSSDAKYPPSEVELPNEFDDFSNPLKVVLCLLSIVLNQRYCIIVDNLYTSPELESVLFDIGTDCYHCTKNEVFQ